MKKNVMMRVAAMLLVCVLASTCGISGTFAKYVTQGSADDTARVAKFGVVVTGSGFLFAETYKSVGEGNNPGDSSATLTVVSSNGDKVIAPGTKSTDDGMNINITGTPEVTVQVTHEVTIDLKNWFYNDGVKDHFYCPLVFNIDGTVIDGKDYYDNYSLFIEKITKAIEDQSQQYAPNTDLSAQPGNQINITWAWEFYVDAAHDKMDTYLGDQAAADNAATVTIEVVTTVTQVD